MLSLKHNGETVQLVFEGSQFKLANGDVVSPAYAGWSGQGYSLVVYEEPVQAPPTIEQLRAEMRLTFAQLMIGLVTEAWITEAEGTAWLSGTLPSAVLTLINTLPAGDRFAAKARAIRPSEVVRLDPLVMAMGAAQGKSPEAMDQFFTMYSGV